MAAKKMQKQPDAKRPGPRKGQGGRPPKGEATAAHVMSLRLSESDQARLDALAADQGAKVEALGVTSFTAADMLRLLIREEHRRRGLDSEAMVAKDDALSEAPAPKSRAALVNAGRATIKAK